MKKSGWLRRVLDEATEAFRALPRWSKPYDRRYDVMRERLSTLSNGQIQEIIDNIDLVLFDEYNYHDGKFCPVAIALNCHRIPKSAVSDIVVKFEISKCFAPVNILKGVPGRFYHGTDSERRKDLLALCAEILEDRKNE